MVSQSTLEFLKQLGQNNNKLWFDAHKGEYNDAKNKLASAESQLLQAKYEYVFRIKVLDFYMGKPLDLR